MMNVNKCRIQVRPLFLRAIILAAGLGNRLRPLTDLLPKPLMPIVGVPNIIRLIEHLKRFGIREIAINTYHLPQVLESALGNGSSWGVSIEYFREQELLGTGGGIRNALPYLSSETFVVVNGDAVFAPNLAKALEVHQQNRALATLVVRSHFGAKGEGEIGLDDQGRICRMIGEVSSGSVSAAYQFAGVHIIEPEIASALPKQGCIVRETYVPLLRKGARLFGCKDDSTWFDIGTPEHYLQANIALVKGILRLENLEPPEGGVYIGKGVEQGRGCRIDEGTVIGDRARLLDGVHLSNCVVLPEAVVRESAASAIVFGDGQTISCKM